MMYNQVIFEISPLDSDEYDGFLGVCDELCYVLQGKTLDELQDIIVCLLAENKFYSFKVPQLHIGNVYVEKTVKSLPS